MTCADFNFRNSITFRIRDVIGKHDGSFVFFDFLAGAHQHVLQAIFVKKVVA